MGIEALRAALEAEGRERVAAALRDGEATAAKLRAEASAAAAGRQREALEREEAALRRVTHARLADARRGAARQVLEAREELLARVFAQAATLASAALADPAVRTSLASGLQRSLAFMPEGEVRIRCSPEAERWVREAVADRVGISVEPDPDLPPGFQTIGAGGALVMDATLERLLELRRPELAIGVLKRLESREWAG